MNTSKGIEVRP